METSTEIPEPLTPLERVARAANFWVRVVPALAGYGGLIAELQFRNQILGPEWCLSDEDCEVRWDEVHEKSATALAEACNDLQGFYAKTGQIIATRSDLFPEQYTDRLAFLTDSTDPMDPAVVRRIVANQLCGGAAELSSVFSEWDDEPLGSATVAQVHRARLVPELGGGEVAVKVQRPSIEEKLLGDVANIKALSYQLRLAGDLVPVDYYTVFSELEAQLADEFDFLNEAQAMERIGATLDRYMSPRFPLITPRPVRDPRTGDLLGTRRVLVMDYLKGMPLTRALEAMKARGVDPNGPEAQLFGRKLVRTLTEAFGVSILLDGYFHADPHPGNLFVMDNGDVGLVDFGQVKAISDEARMTLAKIMLELAPDETAAYRAKEKSERTSGAARHSLRFLSNWRRAPSRDDTKDGDDAEEELVEYSPGTVNPRVNVSSLTKLALELGVRLRAEAAPEGPAATAMWLFDGSVKELPGGYSSNELSSDSPVKELASFPQELVLVGRNTIIIKGIAARLNLEWSLAKEWVPICLRLLSPVSNALNEPSAGDRMKRFRRMQRMVVVARNLCTTAALRLPSPLRRRSAAIFLRVTEWREMHRQQSRKRKK